MPNCRYINQANAQVCLSCIPGFYLFNGICYSIVGCGLYSYITGCVNCISGYLLQGSLCVKDLCAQYSSAGVCQSCISGYILRNATCLNYTANCQTYQLNQTTNIGCTQCNPQYQLINGLCFKLPNNCLSMNSTTNQCLVCVNGFYLYIDFICYQQIANCVTQTASLCNNCSNGYYLSANGSSCIIINPIYKCQIQDYINNHCIQCLAGFQLTNSYYCIAQNCNQYNLQTYVCQTCRQGYYLSG